MTEALRLHLIKQFLVLCVPFATFNEHVQFADHFTFNLSKAIKRHYISVRIQSQGFQRKLVTGCQLLSVEPTSALSCLGQPSIAPLGATLGKCY